MSIRRSSRQPLASHHIVHRTILPHISILGTMAIHSTRLVYHQYTQGGTDVGAPECSEWKHRQPGPSSRATSPKLDLCSTIAVIMWVFSDCVQGLLSLVTFQSDVCNSRKYHKWNCIAFTLRDGSLTAISVTGICLCSMSTRVVFYSAVQCSPDDFLRRLGRTFECLIRNSFVIAELIGFEGKRSAISRRIKPFAAKSSRA
jgi:hypothetical protein